MTARVWWKSNRYARVKYTPLKADEIRTHGEPKDADRGSHSRYLLVKDKVNYLSEDRQREEGLDRWLHYRTTVVASQAAPTIIVELP